MNKYCKCLVPDPEPQKHNILFCLKCNKEMEQAEDGGDIDDEQWKDDQRAREGMALSQIESSLLNNFE